MADPLSISPLAPCTASITSGTPRASACHRFRRRWYDASGYAVPMTYQTRAGRQFWVYATGSGPDAALKAFALPN